MTSLKATGNLRISLIGICSVNTEFIMPKKTETTAAASVSLLKKLFNMSSKEIKSFAQAFEKAYRTRAMLLSSSADGETLYA